MQTTIDAAKFLALNKEIKYYKEDPEGVSTMCKIIDNYANECAGKAVLKVMYEKTNGLIKKNLAKALKKRVRQWIGH